MRQTLLALTVLAVTAAAQQPAAAPGSSSAPSITLTRDEIISLAKAQTAINAAHDSSNAQLAKPANKKFDVQIALKEKFRADVAQILHHNGLTDAQYRRHTYMVSLDTASRRVYDSVVVVLTGARLPGVMAVVKLPVPAGAVGTHLGHIVNGFAEAPALMGLLPAAIAEARIAAGHATLASRQPANLEYMKTHAGHVIHALDPTIITMGPGLGMGVKKAANAVIAHMELAKQADAGATPGITVHSAHIVMCANNTIARADQLLELAKKVMQSATAAEAAALVNQMMSLADQLIEGADGNSDGRITWEKSEGGLRIADEHIKLMLGVK